MKIAIAGLGAIGGWIAARLLAAGEQPVALVTPRHLEPLARLGLRVRHQGREQAWPIRAAARADALGRQDLVIIATKATALQDLAPSLRPMIGPQSLILSAMNGVPWWFFHGLDPKMAAAPLQSVDPGGEISRLLPPAQVLGGVVHLAASLPEPGLVDHAFGQRIIIGDPSNRGGPSARAAAVADLFNRCDIDAPLAEDIHFETWSKLWGNMTMNPVSALTGADMATILADADVCDLMARAMVEAGSIGQALGIAIPMTPQQRLGIAARLGAVKTSMLQDVEARRPIELDALVGALVEIAQRVQVPVPTISGLLGLTRLRARQLGLYRA